MNSWIIPEKRWYQLQEAWFSKQTIDTDCKQLDCKLCDLIYFLVAFIVCHIRHSEPDQKLSSHFLIYKIIKQRLELHNIQLDIQGAPDTDIEVMNYTREEVISIARSMI